MQYHDFFAGTQWPLLKYSFPPGVALRLPVGRGLDLNSHYVNRGSTPTQAEIYVNLHWAEPASVQHIADILWLSHESFALPAHQVTVVERTFAFSADVRIFSCLPPTSTCGASRCTRWAARYGELLYRARLAHHADLAARSAARCRDWRGLALFGDVRQPDR
jgi:hypothetical protein